MEGDYNESFLRDLQVHDATWIIHILLIFLESEDRIENIPTSNFFAMTDIQ